MNVQTSLSFRIQNTDLIVSTLIDSHESTLIHSALGDYHVRWENCIPEESVLRLARNNAKNVLFIDEHLTEIYSGFASTDATRTMKGRAHEDFKTLQGVVELTDFLQLSGITKSENLVVAGGGIIQDLGAFVGACFRRGLPWQFVPTTLLSMADSCIGAKTGINYMNVKNQLALFSAPRDVVLNINFLETLENSDLKSGMAEILKLCITGGKYFVDTYSNSVEHGLPREFSDYKRLIGCALSVKKAVIELDEFERNVRRALNYGHTFGHAIEVISNYKITHGQAVSIGIIIANELAREYGLLPKENCAYFNRLAFDLLDTSAIKSMQEFNSSELLALLRKDKKTENTKATLVLMKNAGETVFRPTEIDFNLEGLVNSIIKRTF